MTILTGFALCRAAMAAPGVTAPERAVLMVLAIMADGDNATCYPPITGETGLTAKTCLSERTVQRAIQNLVKLGHISRRQLRHGCVYTVHPTLTPATATGVSATGDSVTPVTPTPDTQAPTPVSVAPKQPVTTNPTKASPSSGKRATRVPDGFEPVMSGKTAAVVDGWPPGRLTDELDAFANHHRAKGTLSHDWQASWRTWVANSKKWERPSGQRSDNRQRGQRSGYRDPLLDRIADGDHSALG